MRWLCTFCLLLAPYWVFAQSAEEKKATVRYLQGLRQKDGGFVSEASSTGKEHSTLRATSAALRALKYFGGEATDRDAAAKFVKSCFDENTGGFGDTPQAKPSVLLTAVGLMAVVEVGLPAESYAAKASGYLVKNAKDFEDYRIAAAGFEAIKTFPPEMKNWLQEVGKLRNADGSYGKETGRARTTGGVTAMILRTGGTLAAEERTTIVKVLKTGQRADGGYGKEGVANSDLETTYRVMRALYLLKESPQDAERLRAYIADCRNKDGGYGVEPGKPSGVSSTYYAGIILHWLDATSKP